MVTHEANGLIYFRGAGRAGDDLLRLTRDAAGGPA